MIHKITLIKLQLTIISTLSLLCISSHTALADTPGELSFNTHYSQLNDKFDNYGKHYDQPVLSHGLGADIALLISINDFFSLFFSTSLDYQFSKLQSHKSLISNMNLGFRYTIDLFQYVPYIEISIGPSNIYDTNVKFSSWQAQGIATAGLNYRINRNLSVGIALSYRLFFTPLARFPTQLTAGAKCSWHFDWGF